MLYNQILKNLRNKVIFIPRGRQKKKIIDPSSYAYTSKFNGAVINIANKVYNRRKVRKSHLYDLIHITKQTFDNAIAFLEQILMVEVKMVFTDTFKSTEGTGQRQKYIFWKGFQSPAICKDIQHLVEYYNIDLEEYPIRDKNKLDEQQLLIMKKYIFKINHTDGKITLNKLNKIHNFIDYSMYSRFSDLVSMFHVRWKDLYKAVEKLISQGKIELGMHKKQVVIYKDPNYLVKKARWKCENCGNKNSKRNLFCGICGDKRI